MPVRSFVFCVFFCTITSFAKSALPTCSMEHLCDQFRSQKNQLYFYIGADGTRVPNFRLLKEHPEEFQNQPDPFLNPELFQKSRTRMESIFLKTQSELLKFLDRKRLRISNSEYATLVGRIKGVRLASHSDPSIQKILPRACSRPNAIYLKETHELLICPSIINFPTPTLQKIIAHEFGHSIQEVQKKFSCFDSVPKRQRDEIFADWVASEVISESLQNEETPLLAQKRALESQLLFLSLGCFAPQSPHSYAYPSTQARVENIFLTQPEFQKSLRCQSRERLRCN